MPQLRGDDQRQGPRVLEVWAGVEVMTDAECKDMALLPSLWLYVRIMAQEDNPDIWQVALERFGGWPDAWQVYQALIAAERRMEMGKCIVCQYPAITDVNGYDLCQRHYEGLRERRRWSHNHNTPTQTILDQLSAEWRGLVDAGVGMVADLPEDQRLRQAGAPTLPGLE